MIILSCCKKIWVWSWDPVRFVGRRPPHHLSPAEQTTRQGVILWGASATPQPAQQRSDQGRKPVISEQIVAGRAQNPAFRIMGSNPTPLVAWVGTIRWPASSNKTP